MRIKSRREWIINKLEPCNCGCHGQDPWHRASYKRVVTQTSETEGTVKMPYSTQDVRVTRRYLGLSGITGQPFYSDWIVDRSSIVFDR